ESNEREAADWAGKGSETWERMINMDIASVIVDRGTSEVRTRMFRLLARITEADDREFQESYARCSLWARRHDKSTDVNYVAPTVAQMEEELKRMREFHERLRKYAE